MTEFVRVFIQKVLDVRPRHREDYYPMGRWLVSKRLAYAVVIVAAILCIVYIVSQRNALFPGSDEEHISTYKYNSVLLKYAKGKVRIKGKSGWLAYEGEVSDSACNGTGTLMNPDGVVIYEGTFAGNMYEDQGIQYYDSGILHYTGQFHENMYSGEGSLYRESGSLEYTGDFAHNMKEGTGTLYGIGGEEIYKGQFSQDQIVYSSLLGKSSVEVASAYSGIRKLYEFGNERVRVMNDINAMTEEVASDSSVDTAAVVNAVFVMDDTIRIGSQDYNSFDGLEQALGEPTYVGDSYATLPELMIINRLNESSDVEVLNGVAEIVENQVFTEYTQVESYDTDYLVYLHSYEKDGLVYNFVSLPEDDTFAFYYILFRDASEEAA
ncbi:MAG: hypothetical protein J6N76_06175 [Lachnospiraceae bacterium]|nr:hypothetical protein [Lachnospiraceae bacterium]